MSHLLFSNWAFQLSLTVGNQIIAQDVEKMRQPQLSIDERMATLFRIVDTDVESSGKHIDKCRQIDPCAVYAAYGSGEMQSRYQFHDIVRRETVVIWILRPIPERRWMDNKPGKDQSDFEIRQQKRRFDLSSDACGDSFSTIRSCNRIRRDWRRASSCSRSINSL